MKSTRLFFACLGLTGALVGQAARGADRSAALLPLYEKVSTALAADNLSGAQTAACTLAAAAAQAGQPGMATAATAVGRAADLKAARAAFKGLSGDAIALARQQKGYFILHCPMADADWVQTTRAAANPYLGKEMASCGAVTEETKG